MTNRKFGENRKRKTKTDTCSITHSTYVRQGNDIDTGGMAGMDGTNRIPCKDGWQASIVLVG
jgi:hypothetical protein